MLQRSSTSDNENSFYVNLLQVIDDSQELFADVEQFDSISLCFKVISDETLMEESNLRKSFSLFYNSINEVNRNERNVSSKEWLLTFFFLILQREWSTEVMSVIAILIENVLPKVTEDIVLEQTQQYLQDRMESITSNAATYFKESIYSFIKLAVESVHW